MGDRESGFETGELKAETRKTKLETRRKIEIGKWVSFGRQNPLPIGIDIPASPLLVSQGDHGVDAHGAASGNVTCDKSYSEKYHRHADERQGIGCSDIEEHA